MVTPPYTDSGSLADHENISRTKGRGSQRSLQSSNHMPARLNTTGESGLRGLATGIVGPVAIDPGHAPFDALAERGKTAILDDRVVHLTQLAVAQHDVGAAIAARNIVGLPGPEGGFMDRAVGLDLQFGIPEV